MCPVARTVVALVASVPAIFSTASPRPQVTHLASQLRRLYAQPPDAWERWRDKGPRIRLPDGRTVLREAAYRADPLFTQAAAALMAGDQPVLGAWLLGTTPAERAAEAEPLLRATLRHPDPGAAFEAARALGRIGGAGSLGALALSAGDARSPDVRTAATWAAGRIRERLGDASPRLAGRLGRPFQRGVSWWRSEGRMDDGAASFRALAELGVEWVSIHTWDPLQRGVHEPVFARRSRPSEIPNLPALVRNAHAAGLKVMVKPHLEMWVYEPSDEERTILRTGDEAARGRILERVRRELHDRGDGWHNTIEMRSEADWRTWFAGYEAYLSAYARQAQAAGADMFCVGRELDRTIILREGDWRRMLARVRSLFRGPLVYSANFDTYAQVAFWDALDYIGISAYFPLTARPDPELTELSAGWERALVPLEAFSRRFERSVLLTEIGYPAVPTAAQAPWREGGPPAPWLQARCYEAAFRALADRPWIAGAYWWLWEGVGQPPFLDASFSIQGKPAAFVLARWYAGH
jgi:hypothetical protein